VTEEKTADTDDHEDANEEQGAEAKTDVDPDEGRIGEQVDPEERWKEDDTVSEQATCPECGEPVHNLRMTCPMCGHEYKDKEYDDEEAGTEFRAGSEIDEGELGEKIKESHSEARSSNDDDEGEAEEG
jgi:ribosomal protein S27AE